MSKKLALIACSKSKKDEGDFASELYTGRLFKASRKYVEKKDIDWFILSAKWGMLDPMDWLEPYEKRMSDLDDVQKLGWAQWLIIDLVPHIMRKDIGEIIFLAGEDYRHDFFISFMEERGVKITCPLRGLRIGQQIQWLNRRS